MGYIITELGPLGNWEDYQKAIKLNEDKIIREAFGPDQETITKSTPYGTASINVNRTPESRAPFIDQANTILARRHIKEGVTLAERFKALESGIDAAKEKHGLGQKSVSTDTQGQWYKDILAP